MLYSPAVNAPEILQTPLHAWHVAQGAKMAPFAGFSMPIQYSGIRQEHEAVRARAGLFDVSHMGNFFARGPQAEAFLQRLTTNNVAKLQPGDVQYSALCREDGGVIDDILVYRLGAEEYMVVVNAANIPKDWEWFVKQKAGFDVELENRSAALGILSLQGPEAEAILRKLAPEYDGAPRTYKCARLRVAGLDLWVGRTGYTGEDGFEFFPESAEAVALWNALVETGAAHGLLPIGLAARDTLRLESGYSLYGHELTDAVNPLEAGLGWITDFEKGDFIGRDALLKIREAGPSRKITGLEMEELAIPREGCEVWSEGRQVGVVTSGTLSPTLGKGIALALVEPAAAEKGSALQVSIRGALKPARAVARAFYKRPKPKAVAA
jgi:aminomethyltransferase